MLTLPTKVLISSAVAPRIPESVKSRITPSRSMTMAWSESSPDIAVLSSEPDFLSWMLTISGSPGPLNITHRSRSQLALALSSPACLSWIGPRASSGRG
ncbi:MAG TPA: hypothetical protein DD420_15630 [Streptomyces sp.]|nr:hypothetical protein [Streptomyces sp.]